jgi:hypothetical protein
MNEATQAEFSSSTTLTCMLTTTCPANQAKEIFQKKLKHN